MDLEWLTFGESVVADAEGVSRVSTSCAAGSEVNELGLGGVGGIGDDVGDGGVLTP